MYTAEINGVAVIIKESAELFSPLHADRGTLAMLSAVSVQPGMKALDLGCGCGIVGIYLSKLLGSENVWMCDIDAKAVAASKVNAAENGVCPIVVQSDGVSALTESGFDLILTNPPYQNDFAVAKSFIEKGFNRLKVGGTMYVVVKRRAWYENKLRAVFGGCRVYEIDGYFVFEAQKRSPLYANKEKKK